MSEQKTVLEDIEPGEEAAAITEAETGLDAALAAKFARPIDRVDCQSRERKSPVGRA
jgi:hypothetical protein